MAGEIGPEIADAVQNGAPRQLAQRGVVEIGELAHILRHGTD